MKFDVTPELATLIKTLRVRNGVSAKDVAEQIGKSPSYLSKLEGGSVHTIEDKQLRHVLELVCKGSNFYEEVLPEVANLLFNTADPDRLINQVWFMQFDVVLRPVKTSVDMAKDIRENFKAIGKTLGEITDFINENVDSDTNENFPVNQITVMNYGDSPHLLIRARFREEAVEQVVCGEPRTTSYFVLNSVIHTMFRMKLYPDKNEKLPPADALVLLNSVADYMERWGVHSLMEFGRYLTTNRFLESQMPREGDRQNVVTIIASQFIEMIDHNPLETIGQLNAYRDTLLWDPAFALKIIGIPFAKLGDLSYSNKRKLLGEIEELVKRYDSLDEFERKMETY